MKRVLLVLFSVLLSFQFMGNLLAGNDTQPDISQFLMRLGFTAVPMMRSSAGHFDIMAVFEGRHDVRLLVDTGSDTTIIDDSLMKKLNYRVHQGNKGAGIGGAVEFKTSIIESLRVGDVKMGPSIVYCVSLEDTNKMRREHNLPAIDGILGMDLMTKHSAVIDVTKSVLYLKKE